MAQRKTPEDATEKQPENAEVAQVSTKEPEPDRGTDSSSTVSSSGSAPTGKAERPKVVSLESVLSDREDAERNKTKRTRRAKKVKLSPEVLTTQIYGLHQMANIFLPGAAIPEAHAAALGSAVYDCIQEFDLAWLDKYAPLITLVVVTAMVEWPAVQRVKMNLDAKKRAQEAQQAGKTPIMVGAKRRGRKPKEAVTSE